MTRVLVIGLDGATLDLVEPWAKSGSLPHLSRLMRAGSYATLRSVLPVLSSAAWASFMTGTNPGKHGLYDFVRRDSDSYRLRVVRRDHMQRPSMWRWLSDRGRRVCVLNVPMTYPPEPVNGILVSGLGTPSYASFTYPPELGKELLAEGYRVNKSVVFQPGQEDQFLQGVYQATDRLAALCERLLAREEWDLFTVVFRDTDELCHFFWSYMDPHHPRHDPGSKPEHANAIINYYRHVDEVIGRLASAAGEQATIMVVSDHGAGPLYRDVYLNEWLRQAGFLATLPASAAAVGGRRTLARLGMSRDNLSSALRRMGLARLEYWLKLALRSHTEWLPRSTRAEFPEAVDWSRTQAYSFGYHGQIYVNLRGREPAGIVSPGAEYEQVRNRICLSLSELVDPSDGRPVVDRVLRKEDLFHGPCTDWAPDLLVIMRNFSYITRQGYEFGERPGQVLTDPHTHESGSHRLEGLLILAGPPVAARGRCGEASLLDAAPTILHLLGCPPPGDLDGHVLEAWLARPGPILAAPPGPGPAIPPSPATPWSEQEEQEIQRRLRELGYLE